MDQTTATPISLLDAYAPAEIALRVREIGVAKASMPVLTMFALAVLAGAFIALGAVFFTVTMTGGKTGNLVGAVGTAALVWLAGIQSMSDGAVGETMVQIARGKIALDPVSAVARGVLCNVLVCLAVWLCMGARSVTDKILAILFPISAFVACGFEHSVANMYFLPIGVALAAGTSMPLSAVDAFSNLALVTIGNIFGGTVLVALVYWTVYLRRSTQITGTLSS